MSRYVDKGFARMEHEARAEVHAERAETCYAAAICAPVRCPVCDGWGGGEDEHGPTPCFDCIGKGE